MSSGRDQFIQEVRDRWSGAIAELGIQNQSSTVWTGIEHIEDILARLLSPSTCHAHYPYGGGEDWECIATTHEPDCVAVAKSEDSIDVFRPSKITLEHFPEDPLQSFVLIELATLPAIDGQAPYRGCQQFLEINGYTYVDAEALDRGYLDYDHEGREVRIPDDARMVARWLQGKILLVAKTSMWNGNSSTYDGRHNGMTPEQIRNIVARSAKNAR